MKNIIRILYIDDNFQKIQLVKEVLQEESFHFEIMGVDNRQEFEKHLSEDNIDLVLSGYNIPNFNGLQVLELAKEKNLEIPVIIIGPDSAKIGVKAIKMGAEDYIIKSENHIKGLVPAIKKAIENRKVRNRNKAVKNLTNKRPLHEVSNNARRTNYNFLFEEFPSPLLIYKRNDHAIISGNEAFRKLYGYSRTEVPTLHLIDLFTETARGSIDEISDTLHGHANTGEWCHLKKDGTPIIVETISQEFTYKGIATRLVSIMDITDRRKTEEKLKKSEEKFSKAFKAIPDAFAIISKENDKFIEVNDGFLKIVNLERNDVIGHTKNEINFLPDKHENLDYSEELHRNGNMKKTEVLFRMPSGDKRHLLLSGTIIELDNEEYSLFFALDIEDNYQIAVALCKSEASLRAAQACAHIGSWEYNIDTQTNIWSDEMFNIFDNDYALGVPTLTAFLNFVEPDDRKRCNQNLFQSFAEHSLYYEKYRITRSDGSVRWIESQGRPNFDKEGNVISYVGTAQDISDREFAVQALLQSEENFHRSISESPFGIRIVTVKGKTVYVNKALLDIYECDSLEEFIRTPLKSRYTHKCYSEYQERKAKREKGLQVSNYEKSIISKSGEIRYLKALHKGILWNGIKHYQLITQDITEQKNLTLDLIAAKEKAEESDQLKSSFLSNMSHEIRTPMNAIIGFTGLLTTPDLSDSKKEQFAVIIKQRSYDLLRIVDDILDVSKIEAGQMKIIESDFVLSEFMDDLYEEYKHKLKENEDKSGIVLKMNSENNINQLIINTDSQRLKQILVNLINNAIKFTSTGSIEFGYKITQKQKIIFHVHDTGIGIPADKQKIIFDRFRQIDNGSSNRQYGGSGLGLSISKGIVALLKGKIWINSEEGKGSTFFFSIPFTEPNFSSY